MVPLPNIVYHMMRFSTRQFLFIIYVGAIIFKVGILTHWFFISPTMSSILVIKSLVYLSAILAEILLLYVMHSKPYKDYEDLWYLSCICLLLIYSLMLLLFAYATKELFHGLFFIARKYLALYLIFNISLIFLAWKALQAKRDRTLTTIKWLKSLL
jgi:hypothetical protein